MQKDLSQPQLQQLENSSKNLAIISWVTMIFFGFWGPLIIYILKQDDEFVKEHARNALNWWITATILLLIAGVLTFIFIGLIIFPIVLLCNLIFGVLGAIAASNGKFYIAPMSINLLK